MSCCFLALIWIHSSTFFWYFRMFWFSEFCFCFCFVHSWNFFCSREATIVNLSTSCLLYDRDFAVAVSHVPQQRLNVKVGTIALASWINPTQGETWQLKPETSQLMAWCWCWWKFWHDCSRHGQKKVRVFKVMSARLPKQNPDLMSFEEVNAYLFKQAISKRAVERQKTFTWLFMQCTECSSII